MCLITIWRALKPGKKGSRALINENDALQALKRSLLPEYRLVLYDARKDMQENYDYSRRLFSDARIVFGPHGGAFSNLLFASPDTAVLELTNNCGFLNKRKPHGGKKYRVTNPRLMYAGMARAQRQQYWEIPCDGFGWYLSSLRVNVTELMSVFASKGLLNADWAVHARRDYSDDVWQFKNTGGPASVY